MYELKVLSSFSSAHSLRGYNGKCENIHGHNWQVEVVVSSEFVNEIGLSIDFKVLKKYANQVIDDLDHKFINELPYFKEFNPSAENIAKYIFENIAKLLRLNEKDKIKIKRINVYETPSSMASYYE
jgi:6-pyruvoyltetrahydropterin/6-carboxytetrahydropterin synthase